jgi:hypothetical protein
MSRLRNPPAFSINGPKNPTYKHVISKEHVVDLLGKETPGVGAYKLEKIKEVVL